MDAEELIRFIMLIEESTEVEVKGKACDSPVGDALIKDKALLKYILLSLHKLLQLRWNLHKPNEEELKEGKMELWGKGMNSKNSVKVEIKEALEGEEGCFIQPYNKEELEALLCVAKGMKDYQALKAGRAGKNIAYLGDKVAEVLASIPEEVKAKIGNKTILLNFAGEVMALAGFLEDVPKWKSLSKELARCERMGYNVGDVRKSRKKMLENWLAQAKKVYSQADLCKECRECKDFGTCPSSAMLKFYDI